MKNVLLLAVLVCDGVLLSVVQNSLVKKYIHNQSDNFLYIAAVYLTGSLVIFAAGGRFQCSDYTRILGVITGVLIIAETLFSTNALRYGPMSLTNLLSMSSMVIPMLPAGILWNEWMTPLQITAAVLMLLSMALIMNLFRKKDRAEDRSTKVDPRWVVFALLCFLAGGLMGFPQKYQTMSVWSGEIMSYLLYAFLTAVLLSVPCFLFTYKGKKEPVTLRMSGKLTAGILGCGVMMALLHILTMKALDAIDLSVVFPVCNGGRLIIVTLVDVFLFRQKLSKQQVLGIVVGIAAILMLSI